MAPKPVSIAVTAPPSAVNTIFSTEAYHHFSIDFTANTAVSALNPTSTKPSILVNVVQAERCGFAQSGDRKVMIKHFCRGSVRPVCPAVILEVPDAFFFLASIDSTGFPSATAFLASLSICSNCASRSMSLGLIANHRRAF
jgi:hypothetical protein